MKKGPRLAAFIIALFAGSVAGQPQDDDFPTGCIYFLIADSSCDTGEHAYSYCVEINEEGAFVEFQLYDDGCPYLVTG